MKRLYYALLCAIMFMLSFHFSFSVHSESLDSTTLYVGGSGPGNYSSIGLAIRDAHNGDTVFVYEGSYDGLVTINKQISVIGESKYGTVIYRGGSGDCVNITTDNVRLQGFTVRNGGQGHDYPNDAGVEVHADNAWIEDIASLNVNYGIWVRDSDNATIINCTLNNDYDCIWLFKAKDCFLRGNNMSGASIVIDGNVVEHVLHDIDTSNSVNGKPVYYYKNTGGVTVPSGAGQIIFANCSWCVVENQNIAHVTDGVEILFSRSITVKSNRFYDTVDFGVRLAFSSSCSIINNEFDNNPIGIGLMSGGIWIENMGGHCWGILIRNNDIKNSWYQGVRMDHAYRTCMSKNNFENNGWNSEGSGAHVYFLNSFETEAFENYWDDWIGIRYPRLDCFPKVLKGQRNMFWLMPARKMLWFAIDRDPLSAPIER